MFFNVDNPMKKHLILTAIILLGLNLTALKAQEALTTSGGEATGSGGTASYSIGQTLYTTDLGNNGSVAHGVQQPYEISTVTGIKEAKGITLAMIAYPNPTTDFLQLKVESENLQDLSFQLYDIKGRLLQSRKIIDSLTSIAMGNLAPAIYFVKVTQGSKEMKAFKIIKN